MDVWMEVISSVPNPKYNQRHPFTIMLMRVIRLLLVCTVFINFTRASIYVCTIFTRRHDCKEKTPINKCRLISPEVFGREVISRQQSSMLLLFCLELWLFWEKTNDSVDTSNIDNSYTLRSSQLKYTLTIEKERHTSYWQLFNMCESPARLDHLRTPPRLELFVIRNGLHL